MPSSAAVVTTADELIGDARAIIEAIDEAQARMDDARQLAEALYRNAEGTGLQVERFHFWVAELARTIACDLGADFGQGVSEFDPTGAAHGAIDLIDLVELANTPRGGSSRS